MLQVSSEDEGIEELDEKLETLQVDNVDIKFIFYLDNSRVHWKLLTNLRKHQVILRKKSRRLLKNQILLYCQLQSQVARLNW